MFIPGKPAAPSCHGLAAGVTLGKQQAGPRQPWGSEEDSSWELPVFTSLGSGSFQPLSLLGQRAFSVG